MVDSTHAQTSAGTDPEDEPDSQSGSGLQTTIQQLRRRVARLSLENTSMHMKLAAPPVYVSPALLKVICSYSCLTV